MREYWSKVLKESWLIDASLISLPGEYDLNFIVTGDQSAVLKVMSAQTPPEIVDLQCAVL